jgi:GT2 family glycosyltransferase
MAHPDASPRPLISFVVASYNYEQYIGTALRSILDQTVGDFEIVVVDDASTDGSRDVVRAFADPRIALHVNDRNMGLIWTYNRGVSLARGEYLCFLDADDWIEPRKSEAQLGYFRQNPQAEIVGTYVRFFDTAGKRHAWADEYERFFNQPRDFNAVEEWIGECKIHACSVMLPRAVHERVGPRDTTMAIASDFELWTRAHALGCRFGMVQEPLLSYRLHEGSVSRRDQRATFLEISYLLHKNVVSTIAAQQALHLVLKVIDWLLAHPQYDVLEDDQRCRLLALQLGPPRSADCAAYKRTCLNEDSAELTVLGRRMRAVLDRPRSRAQEAEIAALQVALAARDQEISARDHAIAERDGAIAVRDDLLASCRPLARRLIGNVIRRLRR